MAARSKCVCAADTGKLAIQAAAVAGTASTLAGAPQFGLRELLTSSDSDAVWFLSSFAAQSRSFQFLESTPPESFGASSQNGLEKPIWRMHPLHAGCLPGAAVVAAQR